MRVQRPRIGIVMGDAAGIGPEIVLKTLSDASVRKRCRPLVLGSHEVLDRTRSILDLPLDLAAVATVDERVDDPATVRVLDCTLERNPDFRWGVADACNGRNCIAAIRKAVELARQGALDGVVLAPLNKEAMHLAGSRHVDELGLLAELAGVPAVKAVVKWGDFYRSTVVGHVAFRQILARLTVDEILTTIQFLGATIQRFGIARPQIGVAFHIFILLRNGSVSSIGLFLCRHVASYTVLSLFLLPRLWKTLPSSVLISMDPNSSNRCFCLVKSS